MGRSAHHTGISVRANPLQHTGGGPVVEGQLPGAVATHANPHSPQQHGHTRHGLLSWRSHRHIMVGLGLKGKKSGEGNMIRGMLDFFFLFCCKKDKLIVTGGQSSPEVMQLPCKELPKS